MANLKTRVEYFEAWLQVRIETLSKLLDAAEIARARRATIEYQGRLHEAKAVLQMFEAYKRGQAD